MIFHPKVSILLPNLNNRKYLQARVDSIFKQTFTNWELIIVDNYSDDGAWEFFKSIAAAEPKVRISQAPREGMYTNWNNCITLAVGEYVYIATSDDTMEPECLEWMVKALDTHRQCEIAHCCLTLIDENGKPFASQWNQWKKVLYYGEFIKHMHIRKAPYDGYVHAGWSTIYASITQLLIRRSLFEKIGYFRNDLSSFADFEWEMRASLVCDIIHIPRYLATWRRHLGQATHDTYFDTGNFSRLLIEMVELAFNYASYVDKNLKKKDLRDLQYIYRRQFVGRKWRETSSIMQKLLLVYKNIRAYPQETCELIINRLTCGYLCQLMIEKHIQKMLKERNLGQHIRVIEGVGEIGACR